MTANRIQSAALAGSILFQGGWLITHCRFSPHVQLQVALVTLALAAVVTQLWSMRRQLAPHVDMLLLMAGYGGLGMLVAPALAGVKSCCHGAGIRYWIAMSAGMTVAGFLPCFWQSRCLQLARQQRAVLQAISLDAAGMMAGMLAGHLAGATGPVSSLALDHAFMMIGMLAGMAAAYRFRTVPASVASNS